MYPLTQAQTLMQFNMMLSYKKQIVNICTMIYFDAPIDPKLMQKAMELGYQRNDVASTRMVKVKGKYMQYFTNEPHEPIEIVDFTGKTQEEYEKTVQKWCSKPFPHAQCNCQLYVAKLVKEPKGSWAMFQCISHFICDAYAVMTNTKDILAIYTALRNKKPLPAPRPSSLPSYEDDFAYSASDRKQKDIDFFLNDAYKTEPHFTSFNGYNEKEYIKGKNYGNSTHILKVSADKLDLFIPAKLVADAAKFAEQHRVSPFMMYLTALRCYLMKYNNMQEDIMITCPTARRATLNQKNSSGVMVNGLNFRMILPKETPFTEALKKTQLEINKQFRHLNVSTADVVMAMNKKFKTKIGKGYANTSITFQPYFDLGEVDIPCHFRRLCSGAAAQPLYVTIMPVDNTGRLLCNYEYVKGVVDPENIKRCHDFMQKFLTAALKNPDASLEKLVQI